MQPVEEPVETAGEVFQLVARARAGQPAIVKGHGACRLGHEGQRGEGASAEMTADPRGQRPEHEREERQYGRQRSDLRLDRLERGPCGQHPRRAVASRPGPLALVASRRPATFRAPGLGRTAMPAAAADRPREHPPAQAVGPLDRRRDIDRERAEIATIEDHRPPCTGLALHPPPRLVVDGPGHPAATDHGAIREAVERRLQFLVKREPQAQPGEVVQARGEPTKGQCQCHEKSDRDARDEAHASSPTARAGRPPSRYPWPRMVWISLGPRASRARRSALM